MNNNERGIAIFSVLLVIIVLGGSALAIRSSGVARDTLLQRGSMQARYAAEAGLAKARLTLPQDSGWEGAELTVGGCVVVVSVASDQPGQWRITSLATAHPGGNDGTPVRVRLVEEFGERRRYLGARRR